MRPQAVIDAPPRSKAGLRHHQRQSSQPAAFPGQDTEAAGASRPRQHRQTWHAPHSAAVIQRYPGRAANLATTLAIVIIAIASLVGAAFTCWHYWHEEHRATVSEMLRERHALDSFKQASLAAQSSRQQLRLLDEERAHLAQQIERAADLSGQYASLDVADRGGHQ
jgi:uncharacterized protein HemX